jgi:hypothetical protein
MRRQKNGAGYTRQKACSAEGHAEVWIGRFPIFHSVTMALLGLGHLKNFSSCTGDNLVIAT